MIDLATIAPERLRPLRRVEYERLVELGAFEDERVELLRGMLVAMSPQGTEHAVIISSLSQTLILKARDRYTVRAQSPFSAAGESMPEPDLSVVPPGNYARRHPTLAYLIIEVADSSLRKDREVKSALYAESGVPEYWLFDCASRTVEVRTEPKVGGYAKLTTHARDGILRVQAFADVTIDLAQIWP